MTDKPTPPITGKDRVTLPFGMHRKHRKA